MEMLFNAGGDLETTDHWVSEDGARAEAAWVTIRHGQWHLVTRQSPQTGSNKPSPSRHRAR